MSPSITLRLGGLTMNSGKSEAEEAQPAYDRAEYGVNRQDLAAMGERAVRDVLNSGKYGHTGLAPFEFVSAWLADAEFARLAADSAKRDAREERTLTIAEDASHWARWAAVIAILAVVIATKDQIISLIFGHL